MVLLFFTIETRTPRLYMCVNNLLIIKLANLRIN